MRALGLSCLLLVACGDNSASPDAPPLDPDSRPPDSQPPLMSRVWAVGDILVDLQDIAGAFTHGTGTLPFGPGNEPPIRIANVRAFDARGGKIAYVSDATMAGRFDLHVADADNRNPIVVVQGGVANVEIASVALSPDGTKVAFTMDAAIDGGFDLHVAATTAGATPVKVSPDRAPGSPNPDQQDVFAVYTWSADSKFLAFSADLTENNYDQAYVVDTTAATPAAVELLTRAEIATQASGAQGVRSALLFDGENNVYFRARIEAGSTQFQMFKATTAGARNVFELPRRGDASIADAGAFAITPDGTRLVFSADAPTIGQYDLYVATLASPSPMRLTSLAAPGNANFIQPMAISPDGTKVAVVADFLAGDNNDEPFVIHLDGSTQAPRRLISLAATCPGCTNVDAETVQWTADGEALYVRGDITTSNDTRVFRVDPRMSDQTPVLAVTTPANGDIISLQVRAIP
jgi:Tol biopolymer transport system component